MSSFVECRSRKILVGNTKSSWRRKPTPCEGDNLILVVVAVVTIAET